MPGQYRKTEQVSDLDRLEQALTQQGVSFCDLREALSGARKPDLLSDGQPLERLRLVSCRQANPAGARERSGHRRRFAIHAAARGRSLRDALSGVRPEGGCACPSAAAHVFLSRRCARGGRSADPDAVGRGGDAFSCSAIHSETRCMRTLPGSFHRRYFPGACRMICRRRKKCRRC